MMINENLIIGTLGNNPDDVTCSILAVKSLEGSFSIVAFSKFEDAAESLMYKKIDAMVVPGAYPHISRFIMNGQFVVADVFTYIIPPLVFASKCEIFNCKYNVLYNHPATNPLIGEIYTVKWYKQENVDSNSIACLKVLESGENCCAITNASCAEKYGLIVHQIIRSAINMPFVIFKKLEEHC